MASVPLPGAPTPTFLPFRSAMDLIGPAARDHHLDDFRIQHRDGAHGLQGFLESLLRIEGEIQGVALHQGQLNLFLVDQADVLGRGP